jgi:ubiquinone/menaquinone biosynthesis C-methylase UbiE
MSWLWIGLGIAGAAGLGALFYWQLILAEGAYLGPRVVAWTYDWIARRYDAIKQFDARDESWFVAAPLLHALAGVGHPLVLDVATGTGRLPLALLREHFDGQIVGLDLSLGMLRQARVKLQPYDQVHWVWQDAGRLPFDCGTFDAVTCLEALEFMPCPLDTLAEMVRVLAPGGVLFVTNRVGREARLLPGRAIPRTAFEQALAARSLRDIEIRRWQVSYDLAIARKDGPAHPPGRGSAGGLAFLCCPGCGARLGDNPTAVSCPACGRSYAIRDGIVRLSSPNHTACGLV